MKNILCALLFAVAIISNGGLRVDCENTAPAVILAAVPTASLTLGPIATLTSNKRHRVPTQKPRRTRNPTKRPTQYRTNAPTFRAIDALVPKTLSPTFVKDSSIVERTRYPTNENETFPEIRGGGTVTPISLPTRFFERIFQPKSKAGHKSS